MPVINPGVLDGVRRISARVRDLVIDGNLPGAPLGYRLRGATQFGAPQSGTWRAGDVVPDRMGNTWICVAPGTGAAARWALSGAAATTVTITTTGATFSPSVTLTGGATATVYWILPNGVIVTGLTPAISFGSAATRTVRMAVLDSAGRNALSQVQVFNIGYNSNNDASIYAPGAGYNWTPQAVSGLGNVNLMTGLVYLLAEQVTGLTGTIDCSNMPWLTNIELFGSAVTSVNVSGCGSLVRYDTEQNNVASANLNLIASTMYDLRAAAQTGGYLQLSALAGPLVNQYHFCVRDQVVYGMPDIPVTMPAINQLWIWNTVQAGALKVRSTSLTSLQAYSNWWVSADLTNQFPRSNTGNPNGLCDLHSCQLTSVNLAGCGQLGTIDLHNNQMVQATIDGILATVDGFGTSNGTLNLSGNAAPSAAGTTHQTNLTGRGWTVTVGTGGGGAGTRWTYGENLMIRQAAGTLTSIQGTLASAVKAGDLLIAAVENGSTPTVSDSSGNTWTVIGPYGSFVYLAYCLSAAASPNGLTVTAYGGNPNGLALARYTPAGAATFGGAAGATPSAGGLNAGAVSLGDLGIVPAHALVWGALFDDSKLIQGWQGPGFQTGSAGTADQFGFTIPGPNLYGAGVVLFVLDAANTDAALTWYGSGTGATSYAATCYFTS